MNSDVLCNSRFWSVSIEQWTKAARWKNTCSLGTVTRVAEVAREHGWHPPKSLDSDENFKPEHTLFCRELRFVAIYALFFGDLWAKKVPFLGKNSASSRSALLHGIYCIFYWVKFENLRLCAKVTHLLQKLCTLDENFHCHFCAWRKAAKFCHPVSN